MSSIRLPLMEDFKTRSATSSADGLTVNAFYDKGTENSYAVKRPGITTQITGSGAGVGVFNYGSSLFNFIDPVVKNTNKFIAFGNDRFVMIPDHLVLSSNVYAPSILVSTNGTYWETHTLPISSIWVDFKFLNGFFWLIPDASSQPSGIVDSIYKSIDGVTWTTVSISGYQLTPYSITYGNGVYILKGILSGSSHIESFRSIDSGVTWTHLVGTRLGQQLVWNGTVFASITGVTCEVSPDGITWTSYTCGGVLGLNVPQFTASTTSGTIVAAGNSQVTYSIDNGVTWTTYAAPFTATQYSSLFWVNSLFILISPLGSVASSSDGITWSATVTIPNSYQGWDYVSFGLGIYIFTLGGAPRSVYFTGTTLVGSGVIAKTPDISTWTILTPIVLPSTSIVVV